MSYYKNHLIKKKKKKRIAKKLHCHYGQSRAENLKKLLKLANIWDQELKREISVERICDIYLKYKRSKLRPARGFSLSKELNHATAVDLKGIGKTFTLHSINHATRCNAAAVVKSKKKEDIAETIIKNWIAAFGVPRVIFSDVIEFNNELLYEVCEMFDIIVKCIVAEARRSNVIVERHNAVLRKVIKKLKLYNANIYPIDIIKWF